MRALIVSKMLREVKYEPKRAEAYYMGGWWEVIAFGDEMVLEKDNRTVEVMRNQVLALRGVLK